MMPSKCTKQTKVFRIFIYSMTVIAVLLLFSACIGVESSITIREDGTGTVALSYRISHKVAHLGRLDEKDPLVPLPVNNDDFERTVANTDGISLLSSEQNEDEQNVYINADFRFDSVEALSGLFSTSRGRILYVRAGRKRNGLSISIVFRPGAAGGPGYNDDDTYIFQRLYTRVHIEHTGPDYRFQHRYCK